LSDFYWTNVTDTSAPFVGIVEQTNWADKHEYNGKHLVYISAYLPLEDERFRMTKEELLQFYLLHIKKMFPSFSTELIVDLFLWSAPYAQPIVVKGYRKLVPEIVTPLDNLYLSTMAQIYPADRQVSNGIDMAKKAVNIISNKIKQEAERDFSRHSHL
jgi:protoporphyrinogen oxidase